MLLLLLLLLLMMMMMAMVVVVSVRRVKAHNTVSLMSCEKVNCTFSASTYHIVSHGNFPQRAIVISNQSSVRHVSRGSISLAGQSVSQSFPGFSKSAACCSFPSVRPPVSVRLSVIYFTLVSSTDFGHVQEQELSCC